MRLRVAVLGAGSWGINHVRVLAAEPRCELVAVVDPNRAKHKAITDDRTRRTDLRSADAVIGDATIDALVIAAPAATHVRSRSLHLQRKARVDREACRALAR